MSEIDRTSKRVIAAMLPEEIDQETAGEIAAVGIAPARFKEPLGRVLIFAGQRFIVTGYVTKEEFVEAAAAVGLPRDLLLQVPENHFFHRVSTD